MHFEATESAKASIAAMRIAAIVLTMVLATAAAAASAVAAQDEPGALPPGPVYPVGDVELAYIRESRGQPPLEELAALEVTFGVIDRTLVAPTASQEHRTIMVSSIGDEGLVSMHAGAVQHMLESLIDELTRRNLISVFAAPDPLQISESGEDLRTAGQTTLRILIAVGVVTELRTLAHGERVDDDAIPEEERINHPLHAPIREQSPIQPVGSESGVDIIRKDLLDDYIFLLSRHPNRRVETAIAPSTEPGGVVLDYLVTENRPLTLYAQVSNTGTDETDYWRERFGLFQYQLTNNDDILNLDYTTAGFDESHALFGSYERPFFGNYRYRWRIYGAWSQFTASEVGFFDDDFEGESWSAGGEVILNLWQRRETFLDFVAGLRYDDIEVDNEAVAITGEETFLIPYAGLRLEQETDQYSTFASLMFEFQSESISGIDEMELERLGRVDPDDSWVVMQWNMGHSFYLEPLLNREAWEDPSTPKSSTLAHEIALSFRGQHSFGSRLIPHAEEVVGGLYSVRGYSESATAADTVLIASAEYRLHLPRTFDIQPEPGRLFGQPFRWAPQHVYGRPDWDLILKAFFDVGRAINADRRSFETNETLIGTGVGLELVYRRNFNVRLDWGFALEDLENGEVDSGSNRLHVVATILF